MRGLSKNKKWQILCLILAVALVTSVGFNIYQSSSPSANTNNTNGNGSCEGDSMSTWTNFTFTWGPGSQKIVQGTFCLKIGIKWRIENAFPGAPPVECMYMVIEANDDEYEEWGYIGLVFDTNQNGYIDINDNSIVLFANNMTQPSALWEDGFLIFAEIKPIPGPQTVKFNSSTGYVFSVYFPSWGYWGERNPLESMKKGANNPIHICFYDSDLAKVFVRFLFYLPEE